MTTLEIHFEDGLAIVQKRKNLDLVSEVKAHLNKHWPGAVYVYSTFTDGAEYFHTSKDGFSLATSVTGLSIKDRLATCTAAELAVAESK